MGNEKKDFLFVVRGTHRERTRSNQTIGLSQVSINSYRCTLIRLRAKRLDTGFRILQLAIECPLNRFGIAHAMTFGEIVYLEYMHAVSANIRLANAQFATSHGKVNAMIEKSIMTKICLRTLKHHFIRITLRNAPSHYFFPIFFIDAVLKHWSSILNYNCRY